MPRNEGGYPRRGAEKWATGFNGPMGVSSPGPSSNLMGFGKPLVSAVAQSSSTSPRPSSQALKKLASSMKGKKTIARGPHLKAKPIIAANALSNSFAVNIISISSDRVAPLTREKCGSTDRVFEFTMHSLAGQEHHGDPGIGHLDDAGNADSPTDQGNDDESVDARSNHCFSKGSDRDDAGAIGMELEDRVGGPSSV